MCVSEKYVNKQKTLLNNYHVVCLSVCSPHEVALVPSREAGNVFKADTRSCGSGADSGPTGGAPVGAALPRVHQKDSSLSQALLIL